MSDQPAGEQPTVGRFVSVAPFDPYAVDPVSPQQERYSRASQWQLMWWKFREHKLAMVSAVVLLIFYVIVAFAEFIAPYDYTQRDPRAIFQPPVQVRLVHDGAFIGPFVYGLDRSLNMETLKREYTPNRQEVVPLRFFCRSDEYRMWGLVRADRHLFCGTDGNRVYLLGTDRLGRDMLSRIIYGARVSLTIGLVGVAFSFVLGIAIGGAAGYFGGWVDYVVQRVIEVLQCIPTIPLWLALSAIMPVTWSPLAVYFGITIILGLLDWTGLARAVRSKLLALREEEYVLAAQLMGASPGRIVVRHLIPSFYSHLIASATIAVPGMILGETALSFLGLGLRPPITSWGVLLNEAQNISVVVLYPWLMLPVVPVVIVIIAFNFMGDGLRDAADPYSDD